MNQSTFNIKMFPSTGITDFTLPQKRYNLCLSLPKIRIRQKLATPRSTKLYTETSNDGTTLEGCRSSTNFFESTSIRRVIGEQKTTRNHNPNSLLAVLLSEQSNVNTSDINTNQTINNQQSYRKEEYTIDTHLKMQAASPENLRKLACRLKGARSEQFIQENKSNNLASKMFIALQNQTLTYPQKTDYSKELLREIETQRLENQKKQLHLKQRKQTSQNDGLKQSNRRTSAMFSQNYLNLIKPFEQKIRDPSDLSKLEGVQFFFSDLINNVICYLQTNKTLNNLNGCNQQIIDLLIKQTNGEYKLKYREWQPLFQSFMEQLDPDTDLNCIERTDLYKKLLYFNNSVLENLQRKLSEKLEENLAEKSKLHQLISQKTIMNRAISKSNLVTSTQTSLLTRLNSKNLIPLNKIHTLDIFKCEILDKGFQKTIELQHEH